ncbi:oxidoreductase-like domain-containing protein [Flocculibacter collagenilyticus]|uniref:oxidoreductase-like domain-containing protein n=1 Tax=Flocculibacter collagenilyticus TaxID=2744479 RepID=UPI0018F582D0|nr:oxidoreductase-like domain-containing protein [Flocculibacter collagenilyticus]
MKEQNISKNMMKPKRPESNECCGSGSCCPCVWDDYREKLKAWRLANNIADDVENEQLANNQEQNKPKPDDKGRVWPVFR